MPMITFSFSAKANGHYGQPFVVGAVVHDHKAQETARFFGWCPIEEEINPWTRDRVLPELASLHNESYETYHALLRAFVAFYRANSKGVEFVTHNALPVKARLLHDVHQTGLLGSLEELFPIIDLLGCLRQAGEDPISLAKYLKKNGLAVNPKHFRGGQNNPLFIAVQIAMTYRHLCRRIPVVVTSPTKRK